MSNLRFREKVAIVTGGASGLGRHIALGLGREGAAVAIADVREAPREGGDPTAEVIRRENLGDAFYCRTDVSEKGDVDALVRATVERWGRLDILVNNAGVFPPLRPALEKSFEDWNRAVGVNLTGVWLCCQASLRVMAKQGAGKIVNVSSRLGLVGGGTGRSEYCATKGGVTNLTRQLAVEFGPQGINVNAVCPGFIQTALTEQDVGTTPERLKEARDRTPYHRLGKADDVVAAVLFLASDAADFINGHNLPVDGGALIKA